jgi:membrane-associated phospholipid phosphatase
MRDFAKLKRLAVVIRFWVLAWFLCAVAVIYSFIFVDLPTAQHFWDAERFLRHLNSALGSTVILSAEFATIFVIGLMRLVRGDISLFQETLALACLTSMCAYGINDHVLKASFGVPNPADVISGARHGVNLWAGSENSSFPSGHMALAAAFAGVFIRIYKASIWPLAALLILAAGLLIVGDWHFLSDTIAGTFFGMTAGTLVGEALAAHAKR